MRVGWLGKLSDAVTLGAAYSSKMRMSKFDKYKGLFAEEGGFDIPEHYSLGIAFKADARARRSRIDIQQHQLLWRGFGHQPGHQQPGDRAAGRAKPAG